MKKRVQKQNAKEKQKTNNKKAQQYPKSNATDMMAAMAQQDNIGGAGASTQGSSSTQTSSARSRSDLASRYQFLKVLGKGAFGRVLQAKDLQNGETVAIKEILEDETMMNRELEILEQVRDHPNVICVQQSFYTNKPVNIAGGSRPITDPNGTNTKYLNVVTDFLPMTLDKFSHPQEGNSNLSSVKKSQVAATENQRVVQIKILMQRFFEGLSYLHGKGIAHRDIKPENILIRSTKNDPDDLQCLKICDLGSAKKLPKHNTLFKKADSVGSVSYIGTRYYRAPELLYGNPYYGPEIDIWAAGCVLAQLFKPHEDKILFQGTSNTDQLAQVLSMRGSPSRKELDQINPTLSNNNNYDLPQLKPKNLANYLIKSTPEEAVDLIEKLLELVPQKRITAAEALNHRFFDDVRDSDNSSSSATASVKKSSKQTDQPSTGNQQKDNSECFNQAGSHSLLRKRTKPAAATMASDQQQNKYLNTNTDENTSLKKAAKPKKK